MSILNIILGKCLFFRENITIDCNISSKLLFPDNKIKFENDFIRMETGFRERNFNHKVDINTAKISKNEIKMNEKKVLIKDKLVFIKKMLVFFFLFFTVKVYCEKIHNGLELVKKEFEFNKERQCAYILRISKESNYRKRVVLADFSLFSRSTVSDISRKYNSIAAINAAYFNISTGQPLGTVILNHKIVSLPIFRRSVLCFTDNGGYFFKVPDIVTEVLAGNRKFKVDSVNQPDYKGYISVFTPEYGSNTGTETTGLEFSVSSEKIIEISSRNAFIPPDGFVLSVHREDYYDFFSQLRLNDNMKIDFLPGKEMKNVRYAIGGGPTLIKDGKIHITSIEENFKPNIVSYKAPRTAAAISENGDLNLIVLDGRQKGYSSGLKLKDFADFLYNQGYVDAINLDGGGSSTMVVNGKLINSPSDGSERRINGAVIIESEE